MADREQEDQGPEHRNHGLAAGCDPPPPPPPPVQWCKPRLAVAASSRPPCRLAPGGSAARGALTAPTALTSRTLFLLFRWPLLAILLGPAPLGGGLPQDKFGTTTCSGTCGHRDHNWTMPRFRLQDYWPAGTPCPSSLCRRILVGTLVRPFPSQHRAPSKSDAGGLAGHARA